MGDRIDERNEFLAALSGVRRGLCFGGETDAASESRTRVGPLTGVRARGVDWSMVRRRDVLDFDAVGIRGV